jgi:hypothetical protein
VDLRWATLEVTLLILINIVWGIGIGIESKLLNARGVSLLFTTSASQKAISNRETCCFYVEGIGMLCRKYSVFIHLIITKHIFGS